MGGNFERFLFGNFLAPASRARLTSWLIGATTGFDRLRAGIPAGWVVGDKTGNNGADAAGDVAVVWPRPDTPILIAAYTRYGHPTPSQLRAVFQAIGRAAARQLAG